MNYQVPDFVLPLFFSLFFWRVKQEIVKQILTMNAYLLSLPHQIRGIAYL